MEFLSKDRVAFYVGMLIVILTGWVGGPNGFFLALIPHVIFNFLLRRAGMYDEMLLGFLFILVLSDTLPEQYVGLTFAKQLKNVNIILLALVLVIDRKVFYPYNRFVFKFIPFFLVALIALFSTQTFNVSIQKTLSYFLLFLVIPNFVSRGYRNSGELFFRRVVYALMFVVLVSVVLKFLDPASGISHGARLRGLFGNPNGLGVYLTLAVVVITIIKNHYPNAVDRFVLLFAYLLLFLAVFWTGSRSALLGMLLFLVFVRVFRFSQILGFIGFLAALLFINEITTIVLNAVSSLGLGETFRLETLEEGSGRFVAWRFAWINIQDYFFLGRGFGFDEHLMRSNFDYLSRLGHEGGVHNTYLILWLNTGLVGLLFYLRGFFLNFISAARKTTLSLPVMFTIMFSIMFEPWLAASLNPYTALFVLALVIIAQEEFYPMSHTTEIHEEKEEDFKEPLVSA